MTPTRHVVYLHGFTSSPASSKAVRFSRELRAAGVTVDCPDLNRPAFETLTITRMLDEVRRCVAAAPSAPIALIGSSLGGFVALHAAAEAERANERSGAQGPPPPKVDRLVLLAPAVDFGGNRLRQLGDVDIAEWRRTGRLTVFHHAENRPRGVGFQLYEDAAQYDAFDASFTQPALIFQGRQDDAVDPVSVERWAAGRSNVELRLVDDGHQLSASIDLIWAESREFLGL